MLEPKFVSLNAGALLEGVAMEAKDHVRVFLQTLVTFLSVVKHATTRGQYEAVSVTHHSSLH